PNINQEIKLNHKSFENFNTTPSNQQIISNSADQYINTANSSTPNIYEHSYNTPSPSTSIIDHHNFKNAEIPPINQTINAASENNNIPSCEIKSDENVTNNVNTETALNSYISELFNKNTEHFDAEGNLIQTENGNNLPEIEFDINAEFDKNGGFKHEYSNDLFFIKSLSDETLSKNSNIYQQKSKSDSDLDKNGF
ncbi:hypothetical protein EDEG_02030, partial [Edhazardia aedis USNM 41457]